MKRLVGVVFLAAVLFAVPSSADPTPPGQDPHMPNVTIGWCPGGQGGFLATKWCDGAPYADRSFWHQLIMTGSSFTGPVFHLDCVTNDGNAIPPPAPGGCDGHG